MERSIVTLMRQCHQGRGRFEAYLKSTFADPCKDAITKADADLRE
jgi:hypothetical protein